MAIIDKVAAGMSGRDEYVEILKAIRFRVHNAYDEKDLPDTDIENRAVLPTANLKIASRVPNWSSLSAAYIERLKDAVIYQAAIEVLLSESKPSAEDTEGELVTRYETLKIDDIIGRYEDEINAIIADVTPMAGLLVGYFSASNPKKRF